MGLLCCAAKCCGCLLISQLLAILIPLALLAAAVLAFKYYAIPWGEDQIRDALGLASDVDLGSLNASYIEANSCSGCVFGSNTEWPTNTTGVLHFLDSSAGSTASGVIATSLGAAAVAGAGSMLWASFLPSAASALSFSSGFYEMTHIVEQAQFIGMISQLRIDGAPTFLYEFSKELSWTNFNIAKSSSSSDSSSSGSDENDENTRRLSLVGAAQESGPARYAELIGVDTEDLFFYTLMTFAIVLAAIHVIYLIGVVVMGMLSKKESFGEVAKKLYRKVIWASVLALLLAQYIFSMAGFYYAAAGSDSAPSSSKYYLGVALLAVVVISAVFFGVLVVANNTEELRDVGTYEHDQRPFSSKYSAYYDEYNFDNRFFFVPRILLAVSTGAVVGIVTNATAQLLCILGITLLYLILLLVREPNLLRFLYYIGITSVFMKVVLVCMMLVVARDDYFPQTVRDNVAYGIIGVNMFIFLLLFIRQAYTVIHKMVVACRHKKNGDGDDSNADTDINLEVGNRSGAPGMNRGYSRMESSTAYNQQPFGNQQHSLQPQSQAYDYNYQQKLQQGDIPMLELSANSNTNTSNYNSSNYNSSNYPGSSNYGNQGGYAAAPTDNYGQPLANNYGHDNYGQAPANNYAPPSRNQQYNLDSSQGPSARTSAGYGAYGNQPAQPRADDYASYTAAPAPAPKPAPTYDVLAAYLGTTNTEEEDSYTTSPRASSNAAAAVPGTRMSRLSRVSARPNDDRVSAFRDSSVYGTSFSGDDSFVSAKSTEPVPLQRNLRTGSVDVDDVDDEDDVFLEPPNPGATHLTGGSDTTGPPRSSQSYIAFTDSSVGSSSFTDSSRSAGVDSSTASNTMNHDQQQLSIFSDGGNSFGADNSDWFMRRSKTEIEEEVDSSRESYDVDGDQESNYRGSDQQGIRATDTASAYLGQGATRHGENDIGDDDDYDSDSGSDAILDAPRSTNDSFVSARSSDDINYYFAGDRSTQVPPPKQTTDGDQSKKL